MHPAVVGCSGRRVLIIGVVVFLIRRHRSWVKIVATLAMVCVLPVGLVVTDSHGGPALSMSV